MRLFWSDHALDELEGIAERAPRTAAHVHASVVRLVESPFPKMYRSVKLRPKDHVLAVSPYVNFYRVDGDALTILRIRDGRRITQSEWVIETASRCCSARRGHVTTVRLVL